MTDAATGARKTGISLSEWRVIILSSLGGALEFYDFVIYAMFAGVIGQNFFPSDSPLISLTASFGVFALGYFPRSFGGVILGHFGDKFGRRRVFIFSILTMTLATVAIGLLPTYGQIGVLATVLIVLLRLIQGFCLGGELPGAISYVVETAPRKAGFSSGVIFFCVNTGVLLATLLAFAVNSTLTETQVVDWGWRIGFLVGGVLGLISFWLRLSLEETKEFMRQAAKDRPALPSADIFKIRPMSILVGVAATAAVGGFNGYLFFMPGFLSSAMDYSRAEVLEGQYVCLAILSFGLLFIAWLGDRIPRHYLLAIGGVLLTVLSYPFFAAAWGGSMNLILLFAIAGVAASFGNGVFSGIIADIFPTRVRFSGIGMSMNIAFTLFSGCTPLIATLMVAQTGEKGSATYDPTVAAWLLVGCGVIAILAAIALPRYAGQVLAGLQENANDPKHEKARAPWGPLADDAARPAAAPQAAPAE
jgi:MFS family permease